MTQLAVDDDDGDAAAAWPPAGVARRLGLLLLLLLWKTRHTTHSPSACARLQPCIGITKRKLSASPSSGKRSTGILLLLLITADCCELKSEAVAGDRSDATVGAHVANQTHSYTSSARSHWYCVAINLLGTVVGRIVPDPVISQ